MTTEGQCGYCGAAFQRTRAAHRYCSAKCRQDAFKRDQAAALETQRDVADAVVETLWCMGIRLPYPIAKMLVSVFGTRRLAVLALRLRLLWRARREVGT